MLVGDFLYSRAFQMLVTVGSMRIMEIMAETTNAIAEGEVMQLLNCRNPDTTEEKLPARDPREDRKAVRGRSPTRRCVRGRRYGR